MNRKIYLSFSVLLVVGHAFAQTPADTLLYQMLNEVNISSQRTTIERLPAISGTYLWSGKKSEVINLENVDANIAEKTPR